MFPYFWYNYTIQFDVLMQFLEMFPIIEYY